MAIVITGNPGVGKHTISKKIAKKLKYEILDINKIAVNSRAFEKTSNGLEVDTKKLHKLLKNKIKTRTVIVGHLAPYVLKKNQVEKTIILRKNPYKLIGIYKKRKYSKKKITENLGSEILGIIAYDSIKKFGKKNSHQIDTTSKSISNITKTIINILENKFQNDYVDWLTLIMQKNDFKKFFPTD